MIDITRTGKQTAKLKITAIDPPQQGKTYGFVALEGLPNKILYSTKRSANFGAPFEVGSEAEAEVETTENERGLSSWLSSFGGLKGAGNRGGAKFQPKEFYAELAPSVGGIFNHGIDKGLRPEEIRPFAKEYISIMREVRSQ